MKKLYSAQICLLVVLLSLSMLSAPADAYVLKGPHVLALVVKKLGKLRSLSGTQRVTLYDERLSEGAIGLEENVRYLFPDRFRSEIKSETTQKTHISAFDNAVILLDGEIISETEGGFDHYKDILLFRNPLLLADRLASLGVDLGVTSMKRYSDGIVLVIGAGQNDEETKSQLWVDKETLLPVRWIIRAGGENGDELDVWYREWKKVKRSYYPHHIEFYKNGGLVREIAARRITVNPLIPEYVFDIEAVKKEARPSVEPSRENDADREDDIQKQINNLDEIIKKDAMAF